MYMMGKDPAEIMKIQGMYKDPNAPVQQQAIAGPPAVGNTLTFSDVQKLPPEDKAKLLQEALDKLATVVARDHMILMLNGLYIKTKADPKFPLTVIGYL